MEPKDNTEINIQDVCLMTKAIAIDATIYINIYPN